MRRVTLGMVDALEARLDELERELADKLHPLATEHRYDLARRVRELEDWRRTIDDTLTRHNDALTRLCDSIERLWGRWQDDGDADAWKRGST